jgi:serine/threonine protein kinase
LTHDATRPIPAGTKIGPYEIVGWLGAGGMGVVYRARDARLGRDVAIKLIPETLAMDATRLHRFEQEARASGQLNHPNILAQDLTPDEGDLRNPQTSPVGFSADGSEIWICGTPYGRRLRMILLAGMMRHRPGS